MRHGTRASSIPTLGLNHEQRQHQMRDLLSSDIMPRTTIDLDPIVLCELKRRQRTEGKTLGQLASELLSVALASAPGEPARFVWRAHPMGALVDLEDDEAVRAALDEP